MAIRAYEIYEQQGHKDGGALQDWRQAEREIQKDNAQAKPKPESKDKP
ncbi:MAG: DUF2934 domain-containing protein [Proteobacteria bacterium]|nr:DUF2934 domain-containing protein [Pseudomonadota bacterium]MBU4045454.1 DUF2934 domain-containing protein [Gammaproteobacteria bacterium]